MHADIQLASFLIGRKRSVQEYEGPSQGDAWQCEPGSPLLETLLGHQSHQQVQAQGDMILELTPGIPSTRLWLLLAARGPWSSLGSKVTRFPYVPSEGLPEHLQAAWRVPNGTSALSVPLYQGRPRDSKPCSHSHRYLLLPGASPSTRVASARQQPQT